ncbi:MAG: hypothetical protein EOP68_21100, partial [Sphingomonas sp.]
MHRDGAVEIGLRRAHGHRDADRLDDLAGIVPEDVDAHDLVAGAVDQHLHQDLLVASRQRRLHRPEARLEHVDLAEDRAGGVLVVADDADLRGREHRGRDQAVVDAGRLLAEHRVGEGVALADRDRREVGAIGDVADRVDRGHRGPRVGVDRDRAGGVGLDPNAVEAEPADVRAPAGRDQHLVDRDRLAVVQRRGDPARDALELREGAPELERHPPGVGFAERILVIGGGYIAVEFAGVFAALGSRTTLLHRGERLLRGFDDEIRDALGEAYAKRLSLKLGRNLVKLERIDDVIAATLDDGETVVVDQVLMATGRRPNVIGLGLDRVGIRRW